MMNTYEHGIRKTPTSVPIPRMKASRKPWSPSGRNPPGTRSATETTAPPEEKQEWDGDHQLARQASAHAGVAAGGTPAAPVEQAVERGEDALPFRTLGLQQGAQRQGGRQRVEVGDEYGNRRTA